MVLADFIVAHVPVSLPRHLYSYIPGETPLSTTPTVVSTLIGYLVVIFGIQAAMKNRPPQKLNTLFQIHNVILSSGSLLLLVLMLEEILPIVWKHGLFYGMCAEGAWTNKMEFYYMINYYFKYLELLDTIFLAFKKKPLAFLHVFHHSATALLCYSQLEGKTSISWTVITLNLSVHVLMYYYYYATAGGAKIWWKKYLTMMQIIQFIIDLFVVYFGTYSHFVTNYYKSMPTVGDCAGGEGAAMFGCGLLTSYLFLFINFYFQTYKKKPQANGKANGKANGVANGNGKANGYANGKATKSD
ncbi:GNS1/SUR4 membrane protein [Dendrothele bispora CBS 962.96]|uniref:Elongation of fatty acids protein n=1 Tax=Dendrothele bispora (strain CBS 962.96) TaxID=1314807 RepID=A0A4S8MPM9_DENBC|nr:GNS1/SUR4 membrane protein [Dendrothele bispora CBS 962.96]